MRKKKPVDCSKVLSGCKSEKEIAKLFEGSGCFSSESLNIAEWIIFLNRVLFKKKLSMHRLFKKTHPDPSAI